MDWEASEGSVSPGSAMGAGTHSGCSEYRFHLALCQNTCSNRSESHSEFSSSFHLAGVLAIHAGKWNLTSAAHGTENYNSKKNQQQHHDPETTSHLCLIHRTHRRYWDIFIWGFNENWWTGSLSKKIHISREESSIHVTVTKSWQNVFFKYEEWSLSEWHENANPSTWKQQGDNETEFHVSRSAERWRAPQQCLGLSEMPYSINFDRDYVKCSQSGAFIFLLSDRLIFLEFTHGCVNWLVCTVVSAQYVLSLNLQTVFPPALKE